MRTETSEADGNDRKLAGRLIFDGAGRVLEESYSSPDPEREVYQVFRYIYKPQGRDYEIDMFDIDPAQGEKPIDLHRHLVKFDSLGQCVEETDIDSDGGLDQKTTYKYDSEGNLINDVSHYADGTTSSVEYTYGQNHQILSEKGIGLTRTFSRAYRYDARGNRTDEFDYENGALETHRVFQYDNRNRLISLEVFVDPTKDAHAYGRCNDCGPSSGKTIFTRDDGKGTIKEEIFDSSNKLVSTRYEPDATHSQSTDELYDSHGNWIKAKSRKDESTYTYRAIDYY